MCIICIVPAGQDLPSRQELLDMHYQNPHGCGFVSKSLHYRGMSFETFYKRLQFVPKNEDVIIHFRYATHGSVCAKNCHPFKQGKIWFAHNGILDITPRGDMTDSETAFRDYIYPAIKDYGLDSYECNMVIEDIRGCSRFAILDAEGNAHKYGNYEKYHGRYYSNTRHLNRGSYFLKKYYA